MDEIGIGPQQTYASLHRGLGPPLGALGGAGSIIVIFISFSAQDCIEVASFHHRRTPWAVESSPGFRDYSHARCQPHTVQRSASTSAHLPYTPPRPTVSPVADDEPDEAWKANERSNIESGFKGLIQEAKDRLENALQELHKDGTFSPEKKAALVEAFQLETSFIKSLAKEEFEHNLGRERGVWSRSKPPSWSKYSGIGRIREGQRRRVVPLRPRRRPHRAANVAQESFPRGAPPETGPASRNPPASASSPSTSNRDAPPRSPLPTSSSQEPSRDATAPQSLNGPSTDPRIPPSGSSPFYNGTRLPPSPQAWPMPAQERAPPATSSTFKVARRRCIPPMAGTPFSQPPSQANAAPVQEWGSRRRPDALLCGRLADQPTRSSRTDLRFDPPRSDSADTRRCQFTPSAGGAPSRSVFPVALQTSQSSFKAPSVSAGKPAWTRA
ncbi:hypothetical protein B0H10DRAFT_2210688, partial [Mycena sp. CBHHK59/15]